MPELLPGDRARLLPHVVPHEVFRHAAVLPCIVDGPFGLTRDAATGDVRALHAAGVPLRRAALARVFGEADRALRIFSAEFLEQRRPARSNPQRVLIVGDRDALVGRQRRVRASALLMQLAALASRLVVRGRARLERPGGGPPGRALLRHGSCSCPPTRD